MSGVIIGQIDHDKADAVTAPAPVASTTFRLRLQYTLTLLLMIQMGGYDYAVSDITSANFPHNVELGDTEIEVEYVHIDKDISPEDALLEIDRLGFQPATIQELLAFGAQHPEEQRKFPIVALGSACKNDRGDQFVGYLNRRRFGRVFGLVRVGRDWSDVCRFLVVRKVPALSSV